MERGINLGHCSPQAERVFRRQVARMSGLVTSTLPLDRVAMSAGIRTATLTAVRVREGAAREVHVLRF